MHKVSQTDIAVNVYAKLTVSDPVSDISNAVAEAIEDFVTPGTSDTRPLSLQATGLKSQSQKSCETYFMPWVYCMIVSFDRMKEALHQLLWLLHGFELQHSPHKAETIDLRLGPNEDLQARHN